MSSSTPWPNVIGILGGLGPHAHLELEELILSATSRALGRAASDQDYPAWILSSLPGTPDRTRALLEHGPSPLDALVKSAERLAGASFGVIPCNSAHAFLPSLRDRVPLPFIDMIRETALRAVDLVGIEGCIGVLAATGTLTSGLYTQAVREVAPRAAVRSLLDLSDGEQLQEKLIMEPIFGSLANGSRLGGGIKSGAFREPDQRERLAEPMRQAARRLSAEGAQIVLTACTEIPLVLGREAVEDIPLLDPMQVAAEASVEIASGRRALPS